MAEQITNYQCPACTGPLHFAGESGKLECEYCGTSYTVEEIEKIYAEKEAKAKEAYEEKWDTSELSADWGEDSAGMKTLTCPSCGAELFCEETTAAASCPYCGNPNVIPGQFEGTLKPDFVVPFKMEKKSAVEGLKKHYKGKFLLPADFTKANHIEEIKGVYVPFWMFSAKAKADMRFHATRSSTHTSGDYEVTVTSHYRVERAGEIDFSRIPTDASKQMPDAYMDSIEPFDYNEMKPFSTAYMPGYLADKFSVTAEESAERADKRCENSAAAIMRRDVVGYETVTEDYRNVNLKRGKVEYAMMPVWVLNTKWQDQNYLYMMNGQTGKMVGDLPVSKLRYNLFRLALVAGITLICRYLGIAGLIGSLLFE